MVVPIWCHTKWRKVSLVWRQAVAVEVQAVVRGSSTACWKYELELGRGKEDGAAAPPLSQKLTVMMMISWASESVSAWSFWIEVVVVVVRVQVVQARYDVRSFAVALIGWGKVAFRTRRDLIRVHERGGPVQVVQESEEPLKKSM